LISTKIDVFSYYNTQLLPIAKSDKNHKKTPFLSP